MTRIVVTGGYGFLGWHLRVRLRAMHDAEVTVLDRAVLDDPERLRESLSGADSVVHLAGINRAESDSAVETGNVALARRLGDAIVRNGRPLHIVYSNSIQAGNDTAYGNGKQRAGQALGQAAAESGSTMADVRLPNLFGEHGTPHYNSFVATFCYELTRGRNPNVVDDKQVPLLHAQRAAGKLIEETARRENTQCWPDAPRRLVSDVLGQLRSFKETYDRGQIPDLADDFTVDLFNTFRSYLFPQHFPLTSSVNVDQRGELFECVRAHGGPGQTFISTTEPAMTRGDHYHLNKLERFFVVQGQAEISLRRVLDDEVLRFSVDGKDRAFVDMPTMWVHNIRNVGEGELITLFWANQLLDPAAPDTYREAVEMEPERVP